MPKYGGFSGGWVGWNHHLNILKLIIALLSIVDFSEKFHQNRVDKGNVRGSFRQGDCVGLWVVSPLQPLLTLN